MNNKFCIAKVALPLPVDKLFDYYIPSKLREEIRIGMRVKILFGNKVAFGFVVGLVEHSPIRKLNPIITLLDNYPLLTEFNVKLAENMKDYYICSLGEAISCMLPYHLKNIQSAMLNYPPSEHKVRKDGKLTYVQKISKDKISSYIKDEIAKRVKDKKKIIFLVPEIQMIGRAKGVLLKEGNINIAAWHGKLTKKEVLNLWNELNQDKVDLIIGTRSAVFMPMRNLDLIIVENEDDYAYKEDQVPYYEASEIAMMRAKEEGCEVILSSIVPSSWVYKLILDKKIITKSPEASNNLAKIQLSRVSHQDKVDFMIENEIASALEKKQRILIFLNRRGFATFIYCKNCRDTLKCSRCSSNLRYEYSDKKLICPSCNQKTEAQDVCPKCNCTYVKYSGLGVEKLESNLKRIFPQAKILKFDTSINIDSDYDILIATKKILNFDIARPDITIVWNLDNMLNMGDFNSCEDLFRSLAVMSNITKQKVIVSTSLNPEFYLLDSLNKVDFDQFYAKELPTRKELKLPPYYYLALVSIRSINKENSQKVYSRMFSFLEKIKTKQIMVSNLNTRLRSRIRGKYYKYLLIKSKNIKLLNSTVKKSLKMFRCGNVIVTVNINPK